MIIRPATIATNKENKLCVIYTPERELIGVIDDHAANVSKLLVQKSFTLIDTSGEITHEDDLHEFDKKLSPIHVDKIVKTRNPFKGHTSSGRKAIVYDFSRTYSAYNKTIIDPIEVATSSDDLSKNIVDIQYYIAKPSAPTPSLWTTDWFTLCMPKIKL